MAENISEYIIGETTAYTASLSPALQGVELRQIWQLTTYTNLKIRGNISFVRTLNKKKLEDEFYNDSLSPASLGTVGTGSLVSVDPIGLMGEAIDHQIEVRDLGQSSAYEDNEPFIEAANIELDPKEVLLTHPLNLSVATSLVLAGSSRASFDGVIEPFDIRRVVDRSSIELPYIAHSVKSDTGITNERRENLTITDNYHVNGASTRPYLDSIQALGNVPIPGEFSDHDSRILPFEESTDAETFYLKNDLDDEIRNTLLSGFVSGSVRYTAVDPVGIVSGTIYARHGFVFSQNNNNGYDSIAFGGLVRGSRVT